MDIILTHENADFDAVAGLLAAARLYPDYVPVISERLNQNVARFLALYGSAFPLVKQADLRAKTINKIILVDTQRLPQLKRLHKDVEIQIIDHHAPGDDLPKNYQLTYEAVGSITTYLVEQFQLKGISVSSLEATLLMLGIYEDTGLLSYGTTTPRDLEAAAWLLEQQSALDTVRRFLAQPLSSEQQNLLELLMKGMVSRSVEGYTVSLSALTVPETVSEISAVVHRLRDLLESAALFVVVEMPASTLLVARSVVDAIDVGAVARLMGGGGHGRAAAATIRDRKLDDITKRIWDEVESIVTPVARVADLMSYGVQTVEASQPLKDVIRRVRQIGHEGYPVVDAGQVIGLLTRRDLDRADEHQLRELTVRDVMSSGDIAVKPDGSVYELERLLLESGWGQIPVINDDKHLIGIVTRTDLLKYWSRVHPNAGRDERLLTMPEIETMLGQNAASIIQAVAEQAQKEATEVYLVGGVVRDLLLGRPNFDIDFVVESDAISFAETISAAYGGEVTAFKPFGTAKWKPKANEQALTNTVDHVDFATARFEFYEHPTALPTVYSSSIKLDLQRRDFTINTLAIQLSPASTFGNVVDFYGGLRDLKAKLIRVLHSLSFIDDPTRILRAIRFSHRLGFEVEARTLELMSTALPMLGRITGERLRNELALMLRESEPEKGLLILQQRGVLTAITPVFEIPEEALETFARVRLEAATIFKQPEEVDEFYWHILAACLKPSAVEALCERLLFGRKMAESMLQASRLVERASELAQADLRPSAVVSRLEGMSEIALAALWYVEDNTTVRQWLERYWAELRQRQPIATGDTLRAKGLKPGPCYSLILRRLRDAWLDELVKDKKQEDELIDHLIFDERICDGNS
ncbi:MAG: CBS domain-containing protein [Chloroflexi bacterium]|nr:CBS domain-containing protein [Chloroflexota bacterium]